MDFAKRNNRTEVIKLMEKYTPASVESRRSWCCVAVVLVTTLAAMLAAKPSLQTPQPSFKPPQSPHTPPATPAASSHSGASSSELAQWLHRSCDLPDAVETIASALSKIGVGKPSDLTFLTSEELDKELQEAGVLRVQRNKMLACARRAPGSGEP